MEKYIIIELKKIYIIKNKPTTESIDTNPG